MNKENQNLKRNIRILFDFGSQKSFISKFRIFFGFGLQKTFINESLSKELGHPITRREKKVLKPFEGENEKLQEFRVC